VRFLLASAGLLVLAGAAVAARPTAHTLRKSRSGPIMAIAQNNGMAAWLTASTKSCNAVHVLLPGEHDRSLPQPPSAGVTCGWNLSDGPSLLAVASRMSAALWTLHESGPSPADRVMAALVRPGPERQVARLAHASNGTGDWLGGVAGAGSTLAYSWDDVEYVDPDACLSGGSCKQKIANGGIRIVFRAHPGFDDRALPGAEPALQLAAAADRIAYIPATIVHGNRPSATTNATLPIVDATTGQVVAEPQVHGIPRAIALSSHVLAVLTGPGNHDRISWFSATDGTKLGSVLVSPAAAPQLASNDRIIVYRVGRVLRSISTQTGRRAKLAQTALTSLGLSLARGRLIWAENHNRTGRLRALAVG
jgi:hypothetical protein